MGSEFDADTAVSPAGPGRWRGTVTPAWDIAGAPNGGYVLALAVRAMAGEVPQPDPVTVTGHFLLPARHDAVDVRTEVARAGGRHATVAAAATQGDVEILRCLATFADLGAAAGPRHVTGAPPDLPPPDDCVPPSSREHWTPPEMLHRFDMRAHPGQVGFAVGRPNGRGEISGWVRFADGREPDPLSLLLFADAFAPAVFNIGLPLNWVPTVELTVHVRARPAPGWLRARFTTRFVSGGYLEEDGEVWDARDELVALSRQLALAPRARAEATPST